MDLIVILLKLGGQQGDLLGGMLFVLTHFHTFHPTTITHPTCVVLSLANDTHIVGPTSNVVPTFLRLQ